MGRRKPRLGQQERHAQLLALLRREGTVRIATLAKVFDVTTDRAYQTGGFALPAILMLALLVFGAPLALWWLAALSQAIGLLAERWFFFAQAKHPQNLYYQIVS